jgi:predicted nucleic acid-binding protein
MIAGGFMDEREIQERRKERRKKERKKEKKKKERIKETTFFYVANVLLYNLNVFTF